MTLGAYALDAESRAKWVCFDADDEEGFANLERATLALAQAAQPGYLERSRRGGHLWLFFSPISGLDARRFGTQLAQEVGIDQKIEL